MHEYDKIAELTNQYLSGHFYKLTMELVGHHNLHVSITYEDQYNEFIDYDMTIHPESKEMDFLGHSCRKPLFKLTFDRDVQFERAICDTLCKAL